MHTVTAHQLILMPCIIHFIFHFIFQVQFDINEVHVKSGDVVGFTKLNDSFPISYIFHPLQSVDIWYHNIDVSQDFPQIDDVIDFEEMGFPYRFSVTVRFWADIISSPNGFEANENVLLKSNKDLSLESNKKLLLKSNKVHYKEWSVSDKHEAGERLRYMYNVTEEDQQEEIKVDSLAEKSLPLLNMSSTRGINATDSISNNSVVGTTLNHSEPTNGQETIARNGFVDKAGTTLNHNHTDIKNGQAVNNNNGFKDTLLSFKQKNTKQEYKINTVSSSSSTLNPVDINTEASITDKPRASPSKPNIGNSASTARSILNKDEGEYSVSSMVSRSKIGSTIKPPQIDQTGKSQAPFQKSLQDPSPKTESNAKNADTTEKP